MAQVAINGDHAPPTHRDTADIDLPDAVNNKRKREDGADVSAESTTAESRTRQIQKDILQVVGQNDTAPSFLRHTFTSAASEQPSHKKARLSEPASESSTIATRLDHTSYTALHQIKRDAAVVSEELVASIRDKAANREGNISGRPSVEELKQIHKIQSLELLIKDVVDKESQYLGLQEEKTMPAENELANGHVAETGTEASGSKAGTVLTLFGNAPTPKQLFSSMQTPADRRRNSAVKHELPVEEMSLPNGITATKVVAGPVDSKKGPTFEEAFPPPNNLAALQPPRAHKRSTTRDMFVTWEFKDPVQRSKKGTGYTVQSLTVGSWLTYGGKDTDAEATREKRKQRDRALSSSAGESAQRPDKAALEEALAKEEEALFRKAYSSFAPSVDNSNAVVPEETKNLVYWHKTGNELYNDLFAIDPALLDQTEASVVPFESFDHDSAIDVDNFDKVMKDLEALESVGPDPEPVRSKTDVDQVLRQVSELLETLASYQRNRNATLASSAAPSRTPLSPAPIVASQLGKPDEPSEEEVTTYHNLQHELAYLIMKLPPYAVAKLDGDRLSGLGVMRLIKFQTKNIKGVMEEDAATRTVKAQAQAQATASNIANLARPDSSAGQHYSTTANRTPAIGQAANTRYGQQYGTKTPALPQFQRQASNPLSYGTPTASAARPSFPHPNQYTRPTAPQGGFGSTPAGQFYNRPAQQTSGGLGGFGQQFQQTPQSQQRYTPQSQQQYPLPQRTSSQIAAANAIGYQTNSAAQQQAFPRIASPVKPAGFPAVSMAPNPMQQQQRPVHSVQTGSGRATPSNYPSQPHTPVNGFRPPPQALQPRPASTTPQPPPQGPLLTGAPAAQTNGTS
ncbi:hypothetical protein DOTSEDRAFT_158359 [Dothistroma septosporum NZE10]|uniref:Uncharacterized protein n=1 Tax=Dothistroma septosporum (strain NZE10 / CBS 128990) TaxID=675120 RepID=N1PEU5_DOTSN|nr:hypothetical protein DOTSEDRAFT_158359 [Dothistroma septosporum NZE10]